MWERDGEDGDGDGDGAHHGWSGHPGGGVGGVTALSRCQLCLEEMFGCAHFLCHDSTYDMKSWWWRWSMSMLVMMKTWYDLCTACFKQLRGEYIRARQWMCWKMYSKILSRKERNYERKTKKWNTSKLKHTCVGIFPQKGRVIEDETLTWMGWRRERQ